MSRNKEGFWRKNGYFEGSRAEWVAIVAATGLFALACRIGFQSFSDQISTDVRPYERIARTCLTQDQVDFMTSVNQTSGVVLDFAEAGARINFVYVFDNQKEEAQRLRDNLGNKGATVAVSYGSILATGPKYEASSNCEVRVRV